MNKADTMTMAALTLSAKRNIGIKVNQAHDEGKKEECKQYQDEAAIIGADFAAARRKVAEVFGVSEKDAFDMMLCWEELIERGWRYKYKRRELNVPMPWKWSQ